MGLMDLPDAEWVLREYDAGEIINGVIVAYRKMYHATTFATFSSQISAHESSALYASYEEIRGWLSRLTGRDISLPPGIPGDEKTRIEVVQAANEAWWQLQMQVAQAIGTLGIHHMQQKSLSAISSRLNNWISDVMHLNAWARINRSGAVTHMVAPTGFPRTSVCGRHLPIDGYELYVEGDGKQRGNLCNQCIKRAVAGVKAPLR